MRRVAEVVLGADQRMTAYLKHGTVQFAYEGDLTAFVQPKGFPSLEGDGPTARFIRFADLAEVEERADELAAITRAWCAIAD